MLINTLNRQQIQKIDAFYEEKFMEFFVLPFNIQLHFYLTYNCNLRCPKCYMGSSSKMPRDFIPFADVEYFLNLFESVSGYDDIVCFSGGETTQIPLDELDKILRAGINRNLYTGLKTNGSWIINPEKSRQIWRMLAKIFSEDKNYTTCKGTKALELDISVDNVLHPKQSADWFNQIAGVIAANPVLANNINLVANSFKNSEDWFYKNVLLNNDMQYKDIQEIGSITKFKLNDVNMFAKTKAVIKTVPQEMSSAELNDIFLSKKKGNRLDVRVFPNKTMGFTTTSSLRNCAQVSYDKPNGEYKNWEELRHDMFNKLIVEHTELVKAGR